MVVVAWIITLAVGFTSKPLRMHKADEAEPVLLPMVLGDNLELSQRR